MNCREVQSYFGRPEVAIEVCAEAAQHLSDCQSCRKTLETQREMQASLRILREAAPAVTASLDEAVLANYRNAMVKSQATRRPSAGLLIRWPVAVATAAMLILAALFILRKASDPIKVNTPPLHTADVAQTVRRDIQETARFKQHRKNINVTKATSIKPSASDEYSSAVSSAIRPDDPQEFRSLMYCDELSCDGGMEVVRVQLPAFPSGFLPSANTVPRAVSADVLVGPDGFARGIRFVH